MNLFVAIKKRKPIKRKNWEIYFNPKIYTPHNNLTHLFLRSIADYELKTSLDVLDIEAEDWEIKPDLLHYEINCKWRLDKFNNTYYPSSLASGDIERIKAMANSGKRYILTCVEVDE